VAAVSLLDTTPPAQPPRGRRPLRYQRVIDLVDEIIRTERLQPGSLLPTQKELARRAGVSLITVRRALDELERAGRVAGHQGVGTFVARPRIVTDPVHSGGLLSTFDEQAVPRSVETRLLKFGEAAPRATVAHTLQLREGALVWQVERLRHIDGRPCVIEEALIPLALAAGLDKHRGELTGSLYSLLGRVYGLVDHHEEQYLEIAAPGRRERRLLDLPPRARVVRLRGVSFTPDDVAFDCFEQIYPADDFVFYISGQTARRLFRPADLNDWGALPVRDARDA
jgi:DNA-binding GntR family transcriptional regulator